MFLAVPCDSYSPGSTVYCIVQAYARSAGMSTFDDVRECAAHHMVAGDRLPQIIHVVIKRPPGRGGALVSCMCLTIASLR